MGAARPPSGKTEAPQSYQADKTLQIIQGSIERSRFYAAAFNDALHLGKKAILNITSTG